MGAKPCTHPPACMELGGGRIKGLHRPTSTGIPRGSVEISAYPISTALNFHQMPLTRLKSRHQGMHHSSLAGETETQVGAVAGLRSWSQQHWGELGKFLLLRSTWGSLPHPIGPRGHAGISALAQVQTCPCVPSSGM